jgi:hypothetical protein
MNYCSKTVSILAVAMVGLSVIGTGCTPGRLYKVKLTNVTHKKVVIQSQNPYFEIEIEPLKTIELSGYLRNNTQWTAHWEDGVCQRYQMHSIVSNPNWWKTFAVHNQYKNRVVVFSAQLEAGRLLIDSATANGVLWKPEYAKVAVILSSNCESRVIIQPCLRTMDGTMFCPIHR